MGDTPKPSAGMYPCTLFCHSRGSGNPARTRIGCDHQHLFRLLPKAPSPWLLSTSWPPTSSVPLWQRGIQGDSEVGGHPQTLGREVSLHSLLMGEDEGDGGSSQTLVEGASPLCTPSMGSASKGVMNHTPTGHVRTPGGKRPAPLSRHSPYSFSGFSSVSGGVGSGGAGMFPRPPHMWHTSTDTCPLPLQP